MFYAPDSFPFTKPLEDNWERIRDEFLTVKEQLTEWVERELYDNSWGLFMMYSFPHGDAIPQAIARCPLTSALIRDIAPTHGVVTFSSLKPQTNLSPHVGYQGEFLRVHLGLVVPEGDCALRVQNETRSWEQGKVMVFDDRFEHSAWNRTNEERSVLLFDFVPDPSVYAHLEKRAHLDTK